jgi:4-azaleucine resistance transporter AzlC
MVSASRQKRRLAVNKGILDMLPLSFAVLPWGILFGSLAVQRGFTGVEAQLFSLLVFGGSVQLVSVELLANGTSVLTVLISAFIISSRHFLYGLSLRERISHQPARWRLSLGFLLTDELFALSGHTNSYKNQLRLWYALGAGGSFYLAWNLWTLMGIVAGSTLPDLTHLGLDFAIACTFIALVVPEIKSLATLISVIVAGFAAVIFNLLNFELALISAVILAMLAGFAVAKLGCRT